MAYANRENATQRTGALIAVAAVHAIGIYAVVSGLSVVFTPEFNPPPIAATNSPLPVPEPSPPPPKHPRASEKTHEINDTSTPRPLSPPIPEPLPIPRPDPNPQPSASTGPSPMPFNPPSPKPIRSAKPHGNPGTWASAADYPARDLREGNAGVVGFRLTLDTTGKVSACAVTRSSGFASLDAATCRLLASRARFDPALDSNGLPTSGSYAGAIRWEIPD